INGDVRLYGATASTGLINDELGRLRALLKKPEVNFLISDGNLNARHNRLTRVVIARRMIDRMKQVIKDGKGDVSGLFATGIFTGNIISEASNIFAARHLALNANVLTRLLPLRRAVVTPHVAIASGATYVGNHSFTANTQLINASTKVEGAANIDLNIV
ncbi:MAG: hypothetical protein M3R15_06845, partial [Acidobacteriota bacterium]|nr:hypothetical protein [Acidobacteriota bacterium]